MAMDSSTRLKLYLALIAVGIILLFAGRWLGIFSLVSIGHPVTLNIIQDGKPYKYVIYSSDDYDYHSGCDSANCYDKINGCNLVSTPIGTQLGCTVINCKSTGTWVCESGSGAKKVARDNCAYGETCKNPAYYRSGRSTISCDKYCDWETRDYGDRGGYRSKSGDGCSWYIEIFDEAGNLVHRNSQKEQYALMYDGDMSWGGDLFTTTELINNDWRYDIGDNPNFADGDCR
jgi:hypothetical protein